MKSFTSLEQSKKLAEILPVESADFHFSANQSPKGYLEKPIWGNSEYADYSAFPCWSLAALLSELPDTMLGKDKNWYVVMVETMGSGLTTLASDPIDACVEMICELKERDLL